MKIMRSTKCSLKFATAAKRAQLDEVLTEYGRVVNAFTKKFWYRRRKALPTKNDLLAPIVNSVGTWLSARLRKVAAREALDMIKASMERDGTKAKRPTHRGNRICCSSTIATLYDPHHADEFDAWLVLTSLGNKIRLDLPIRFHKHFNGLLKRGRRCNSYVITRNYVQFAFEIETGPKKKRGRVAGVDTGINTLAAYNDGSSKYLLGPDIKELINKINRCEHGSKRQKRLRRSLRQRMDEVAKLIAEQPWLRVIVVEKLRKMNYKTKAKRRLAKNMRRSLGAWNYRYWLNRVQRACEDNRVAFRSIPPQYTSQECLPCGHIERGNRKGEKFHCLSCGYTDHADLNGGGIIRKRFLTGPYGAGY